MIMRIEEALKFIRKVKICTIFNNSKGKYDSLWENVGLPDKQPGEKGWGQKMGAVWSWKNKLPALYPGDVFYGKIQGGIAVLMDMDYLRKEYFPKHFKPISASNYLANAIYRKIIIDPVDTTRLRNEILAEQGVSRNQFDKSLKDLQVSLNIVRLNELNIERDTWVPFKEVYLDIWDEYSNLTM